MIIEVQGYDPRDASKNSYVFKKYDPANPPPNHFPVKELNLRSDENLYVMQGKLRPAVVLQIITTDYYNLQNPEPYVWVAPCSLLKKSISRSIDAGSQLCNFRTSSTSRQTQAALQKRACSASNIFSQSPRKVFNPFSAMVSRVFSPTARGRCCRLQQRLHLFVTNSVLDQAMEEALQAYTACLLEAYGLR